MERENKEIRANIVRLNVSHIPKQTSSYAPLDLQKLVQSKNGLWVISIDVEGVTIKHQGANIQLACWVAITDGLGNTIYEKFVKYPKRIIKNFGTFIHGLDWNLTRYSQNLVRVRHEVLSILDRADIIIGCDIESDIVENNSFCIHKIVRKIYVYCRRSGERVFLVQ